MGLLVFVYRAAHGADCTNGGVSAKADTLCLVNADGPFNPCDKNKAVLMVPGNLPGCLKIVPAKLGPTGDRWVPMYSGTMMGGNYACTSDSRFNELKAEILCISKMHAIGIGPIPIHDRVETGNNYAD